MTPNRIVLACGLAAALAPGAAAAWELSGVKQIALHTRDGQDIQIGTVTFTPDGNRTRFTLDVDRSRFKDFFLSMREFKCLEGPEVQCLVPYPYPHPETVTATDFSWLEHSLIFMFKTPSELGAKLANGVVYQMTATPEGLVGTPYSVDLNQIASPPDDPSAPPFGPAERQALDDGSRWVTQLSIR